MSYVNNGFDTSSENVGNQNNENHWEKSYRTFPEPAEVFHLSPVTLDNHNKQSDIKSGDNGVISNGGIGGGDNKNNGNGLHHYDPQLDGIKDHINEGEEDEMEIEGYVRSKVKTSFIWILIICTVGLLRLVFHWWPKLMLYATHRRSTIAKAEKILVIEHYQGKYKRYHVKPVYILTSDLFEKGMLFPAVTGGKKGSIQGQDSKSWNSELAIALDLINSPNLIIPNSDGTVTETKTIRTFTCKKLRYIWNEGQSTFIKLIGFDNAFTSNLHAGMGLSIFEQCQRRLIYGNNEIKVEVQSIVKLLFLEVLNPFYVFQICSVSLWLIDNYVWFAGAVIIMSLFGITSTIIQTRQNQKKLKITVHSADIVTVSRGNDIFESVPTEHLVPGDLIVIPAHGCTMNCDAALLVGSCIVNESMLTGESVPVTKTALPNRSDIQYDAKEHARHTLFCGTHVIQTRYYGNERVLAVVLRTGFLTAKGSLVRSIMYPPPVDYKFEKDSYKFVGVLACVAGIGFIYSIFIKISSGHGLRDIIVHSLDLITIVVPPALPAAMTVGRFYAQRRLQKQGVYCISPRAINVSGSIDCVCFDKTGTLTEDGLDLWGVISLRPEEKNRHRPRFEDPIREGSELCYSPLMTGMAACHSLTRIDEDLIGDPLDLKMFEWVGWTLEEPGVADTQKFDILAPTIVRPNRELNHNVPDEPKHAESGPEVGIVRQFPFSSSLQRMSVITRTLGDSEYEVYCKGSPEMISSLALPHTIPKNFAAILESYTQEGYRVIAMGYRRLPKLNYIKIQRVMREELESELTFLGLIVMENRLKPETTEVMNILKNAAIRTVMVTGDNLLTAISVARECEMLETSDRVIVLNCPETKEPIPKIQYTVANRVKNQSANSSLSQSPHLSIISSSDVSFRPSGLIKDNSGIDPERPKNGYHFALTGNVFGIIRAHYPELLSKILVRGTIFARMSPEQKQQLVELLQGIGYFVGMCGDGSNDCGALKAAHAGISLSDTESSVAAPFTSKEANIRCVPHLIREGRGALVTSFGIFKYMAIYSLTQFTSVIMLYNISSCLGDLQFLYIDLFLISIFAFFFGNSEPNPGPLAKSPPSASLVSAPPILSILLHLLSIVGFQVFSFFTIQSQPWFKPYEEVHETTATEIPHLANFTTESSILATTHDSLEFPKRREYEGYENYALFVITCFQYIMMAVVFSRGKPYRRPIIYNPGLMIALVGLTTFTAYIALYPAPIFQYIFLLSSHYALPPEFYFRLALLGVAFVQFLLALFLEHVIVDWFLKKVLKYIRSRKRQSSKTEYVRIEYELSQRPDWPPISCTPSVDSVYLTNENEESCHPPGTHNSVHLNNQRNEALSFQILQLPEFPTVIEGQGHGHLQTSSLPRPRPKSRARTASSNSYTTAIFPPFTNSDLSTGDGTENKSFP